METLGILGFMLGGYVFITGMSTSSQVTQLSSQVALLSSQLAQLRNEHEILKKNLNELGALKEK